MSESTRTSATLIKQLKDVDTSTREAAWKTVFEIYESRLTVWARKTGARDYEILELIQDTWVAIWEGMDSFSYDASKSFRAYLKTVICRQTRLFMRKQNRELDLDPNSLSRMEDQSLRAIDAVILDAEKEIAALELCQQIQDEVSERDWLIWRARQMRNDEVASIAKIHDVTESNVYQIVSRVNKLINKEVSRLNEDKT